MKIRILIFLLLGLLSAREGLAQKSMTLANANFQFSDSTITVSTGKVARKLAWTGNGFVTISYKNTTSGKEWAEARHSHTSDWDLPTKIGPGSSAKLLSVACVKTDDEQFTTEHLLVTAHMTYNFGLDVKYLIRVYPDAPGIWTALEVKANSGFSTEGIPVDLATRKYYGSNQPVKIARNEFVPIDFSKKNQRRYWGIYNNPGNRVNTDDMVKERIVKGYPIFQDEQNTWANGVAIEAGTDGFIALKESNKTVNKYGHQTGSFFCTPQGIEVTGWGLKPDEISSEFKRTWATWTILYTGGEPEMQLALKRFDRIRYPVNMERDMHILIDTWGSDWQNGDYDKIYGRENSEFSVIEKEIKSAADLGIDIVRIDDGWQEGGTKSKNSWHPNTKVGYDANWAKTKKLSDQYNVRIGLWAAVLHITPEELIANQEKLQVATWKFDFDQLEDHDSFARRLQGIRAFIKKTGYTTQTSWCPEYDDQRYGWYSPVRECGPMYFQNIQNNLPTHLAYVPYITLRHHWMMARYYNLNDLQCHWQNTSRTNPRYSDAHLHSQSYAAMSAFMGAPSCFMLTQLLEPEERDELRKVIATYKANRQGIFQSYVFPIGDEPNNASWTGFQLCDPDKSTGYLMIFRELHNLENTKALSLNFLANKTVRLIDLEQSNTQAEIPIGNEGKVTLNIPNQAGYRFLRYEIIDK
ncbi:hypothetical protein QQ020_22685 [Fulvivirgaceae bacterium BMA12]|uniref:Alpha-galactosidase n=1 Tax=Agaribacillus aureus TaxID=3051825 RepID=A0ABT8LAW8_9BACT|nr:hypothetical protein [Fulvivirgaceae bacterium BMA12]